MTSEAPAPPPGYAKANWTRGFAAMVGPIYERHGPGGDYARAFLVEDKHANGMGNAHGGMLLTFADMAFGHAVSVSRAKWWVTVRLICDFLGPAHVGDWVEGAGEVLHEADDLFTIRGRLWVGERMILTGTGLFKAVAPRGKAS